MLIIVTCFSLQLQGVYYVVAMTVDRYLAICYPLKFMALRTPSVAHKVGIGIGVFFFFYTMPYLYTAIIIGGTCSGEHGMVLCSLLKGPYVGC